MIVPPDQQAIVINPLLICILLNETYRISNGEGVLVRQSS